MTMRKSTTDSRSVDGVPEYLPGLLEALTRHSDVFEEMIRESRAGVLTGGVKFMPLPAAGGIISHMPGKLYGWSIADTGSATGTALRIRDGIETGLGDVMGVARIAVKGETGKYFDKGIGYVNGLFVEVDAGGQIEGAIFYGPR